MKKSTLVCALCIIALDVSTGAATIHLPAEQRAITTTHVATPLAFTKNMGQWPDSILFQSNAQGATIWFTSTGILCQFARRVSQIDRVEVDNKIPRAGSLGRELEHDSIEVLMSKATFVGANYNIKVIPEGMLKQKYNYILGKNPSDWRTNVPSYAAITLRGIYPGVDVRYTGDNAGQIVYKFVTAPEADLSQIKVAYENAATLRPTIRST